MSEKVVEINYCPGGQTPTLRALSDISPPFLLTTGNVNLIFCNYKYKSQSYLVTIKLLTSPTIHYCPRDKLSVNIFPPFLLTTENINLIFCKNTEFQVVTINKLLTFPTINHLSSINPDQREYQLDIFCNYKYS